MNYSFIQFYYIINNHYVNFIHDFNLSAFKS